MKLHLARVSRTVSRAGWLFTRRNQRVRSMSRRAGTKRRRSASFSRWFWKTERMISKTTAMRSTICTRTSLTTLFCKKFRPHTKRANPFFQAKTLSSPRAKFRSLLARPGKILTLLGHQIQVQSSGLNSNGCNNSNNSKWHLTSVTPTRSPGLPRAWIRIPPARPQTRRRDLMWRIQEAVKRGRTSPCRILPADRRIGRWSRRPCFNNW